MTRELREDYTREISRWKGKLNKEEEEKRKGGRQKVGKKRGKE